MSVDFPAPVCPTTATRLPLGMTPERSRTTLRPPGS